MKRNFQFVCGAALLGVLLSGCSFSLPKKYKVVTKADYNFTLMNKEIDLSSMIPVDSMFESMPETMNHYLYNPGGNSDIQQFLMTMPVGDPVELDMSKYIQDDLYKGEPVKFEKTLEMPAADISETKYFSTQSVSGQMNSMVKIFGPVTSSSIEAVPEHEGESFESITYESGTMKIYIQDATSGSSTVDIKKDGISLIGGPAKFYACTPVDKKFTALGSSSERTMNYCATVDLAGKSIYMNNIEMAFTGCPGYLSGNTFYAEVLSSSVVSGATGVKVTNYTMSLDPEDVTLNLGDSVKTLKISEGAFTAAVTEPAGWTNADISFSYTTTGALELPSTTETASLNGKTLENGAVLTLTPSVTLNLSNATLDLTKNIQLDLSTDIRKIAEVILDTTKLDKKSDGTYKDLETSQTQNESLTEDVTKSVKEIWFDESTFDVKYTNTLPEGNDIDLNVTSTFLSLNDSVKMKADTTDKETSFTSTADNTALPGKSTKKGDGTPAEVDFKAEMILPGYDATENTITLKNIVPSKGDTKQTYKVAIEVTPHVEWIQAMADLTAIEMPKQEDPTDTGISFYSIMSNFGEDFCNNVKMESVPVYIYSEKPEMNAFENVSVTGKISIFCDKDGKKIEFLEESQKLDLSANRPDLLLDEDEKTAKVDLAADTVKNACSKDIADIIDFSSEKTLKIKYELNLSGIDDGSSDLIIKKSDLDGKKSSFSNYAYIVLPMSFKVLKETKMGISGLTGEGDLLGRTEAPSEDSSSSNWNAIESFTLYIHSTKIPFKTTAKENVSFYMDFDGDEYEDGKKLDLEDGTYQLTRKEINDAMSHYPFMPEIKVNFPAGVLSLKNDMTLKSRIDFELKTDGTLEIPVSGSDE